MDNDEAARVPGEPSQTVDESVFVIGADRLVAGKLMNRFSSRDRRTNSGFMESYAEADILRRLVRQATTSRPLAWLSARVLHRIDHVVNRATRGRTTFSAWASGLPVVLLTTKGARTGLPRTTPVLGIPDGDRLVVIASNFGKQQHPAWYHNLRTHPGVSVTADGLTRDYRAHQLAGEERDRQFQVAVRLNPGWLRYRSWAGERQIPVIMLEPTSSQDPGR